jgi:hypothetical protein
MITTVAGKLGRARRYKCTCGHCEDLKDESSLTGLRREPEEALNLEGFQEIP